MCNKLKVSGSKPAVKLVPQETRSGVDPDRLFMAEDLLGRLDYIDRLDYLEKELVSRLAPMGRPVF